MPVSANPQATGVSPFSQAQAAAVQALVSRAGIPSGLAVLGDSYFANAMSYTGGIRWSESASSAAFAINTLLGGPFDLVTDGSLSGTSSAQWITNAAQLPAVLAGPAQHVMVAFPTNDPILIGDAAASIVNLSNIYSQIAAAGKRVIVCNGSVVASWTAAQRGIASAISEWIMSAASAAGWPIVDTVGGLVNPATGAGFTAHMMTDAVHPNPVGALYSGALSVQGFAQFPARPVNSANSPSQAFYNAAMDGDVGGFPTGWSAYTTGAPTGTGCTKVARTDGSRTFARLAGTSSAASGDRFGMQTATISLTAAWSTGAKALGARVKGSFGDHWVCTTAGTSSGTEPAALAAASVLGQTVTDSGGVVWTRYKNIVPGVSKLTFRVEFDMTSVSGGNLGAQPVLQCAFNGSPTPHNSIRTNMVFGVPGELMQRWNFSKTRRPVLVSPYQVLVPTGSTAMTLYAYQQWDSIGATSNLDVYGIESRID